MLCHFLSALVVIVGVSTLSHFFASKPIKQGCTRQFFFSAGQGGAEETNFGVGRAGQGVKSLGAGLGNS